MLTWNLTVRMLSGNCLGVFTVDEFTRLRDILDSIDRPRYAGRQLLADKKVLVEEDATLRQLDIVGVREPTAVFRQKNRFCPRCRAQCRAPEHKDKVARIMQHDKDSNPTHETGLRFSDCDVGAQVSRFKKDQTIFDCFNNLQVHALNVEDWLNRGHQAIYTNVFANTHDYDTFSKTVVSAMNEGHIEIGYWKAASGQNIFSALDAKFVDTFSIVGGGKGQLPRS